MPNDIYDFINSLICSILENFLCQWLNVFPRYKSLIHSTNRNAFLPSLLWSVNWKFSSMTPFPCETSYLFSLRLQLWNSKITSTYTRTKDRIVIHLFEKRHRKRLKTKRIHRSANTFSAHLKHFLFLVKLIYLKRFSLSFFPLFSSTFTRRKNLKK